MKMEMSIPNLKRHAEQVAQGFQIVLVEDRLLKREQGRSMVLASTPYLQMLEEFFEVPMPHKVVHVFPIDDETSYAVAMHEIGHQVAPNGFCLLKRPKEGCHPRVVFEYLAAKLVCEEAAWEWAQYYIEQVFMWTAAMEMVKQYGLNTYRTGRRLGGVQR